MTVSYENQNAAIINRLPGSERGYQYKENPFVTDMAMVAVEAEALRSGPSSNRIRSTEGLAIGAMQNLPIVEGFTNESLAVLDDLAPEFKRTIEELERLTGGSAYSVSLLYSKPGTEIPEHRDPESVAAPRAFALIGIQGTGVLRIKPDLDLGMEDSFEQEYGPGDVIILDPIAVYEDGHAAVAALAGSEASDPTINRFITRTHSATSGSEERIVALVALSVDNHAPATQQAANLRAARLAQTPGSPYYVPPRVDTPQEPDNGAIVIDFDSYR